MCAESSAHVLRRELRFYADDVVVFVVFVCLFVCLNTLRSTFTVNEMQLLIVATAFLELSLK